MLRSPALKKLINKADGNTISFDTQTNIFSIKNVVSFDVTKVAACSLSCPTDSVKKKVKVCLEIPESCECPEELNLTVVKKPNLTSYKLSETFDVERLYQAVQGVAFPFTAIGLAAYLAASINSDANANVVATVVNVDPNDPLSALSCLVLESKTVNDDFEAYLSAGGGTITVLQEFVKAALSPEDMAMIFPIQPGHFASTPDLPNCGTYCRWRLKVVDCCSLLSDSYDLHGNRAVQGYENEFELYLNIESLGFINIMRAAFEQSCIEELEPGVLTLKDTKFCNCFTYIDLCVALVAAEGNVVSLLINREVTSIEVDYYTALNVYISTETLVSPMADTPILLTVPVGTVFVIVRAIQATLTLATYHFNVTAISQLTNAVESCKYVKESLLETEEEIIVP